MRTEYIRRIVAIAVMCAVFCGCWKLFGYLTVDDTESYTRIAAHEFYEQDNIDVLFVGPSHCYRGIDPAAADDRLGRNTFNAGSSSQSIDISYAVIKEALKRYDVEHVCLELSYAMACYYDPEEKGQLINTYIVSDYMKASPDKLLFLLRSTNARHFGNSFFPARRNWRKTFDVEYVKNLVAAKQGSAYLNYEPIVNGSEEYRGKGYVASHKTMEDGTFYTADSPDAVGVDRISPSWFDYLDKIIRYCSDKGVQVTLICAPISTYRLLCWENYDAYIQAVREAANKNGADFYDFNLCREQYWPDTSILYKDNNHLNAEGAEKFTELLCDVLAGSRDPEQIFYGSVKEKFEHLPGAVYGMNYRDEPEDGNGETVRSVRIVANNDQGYRYQVEKTAVNEETGKAETPVLLQDYSENKTFRIPAGERGTFRVSVQDGSGKEVGVFSIKYVQ